MSKAHTFTVESLPLNENIDEIRELWSALEQKTNASFFQRWAWIGPWWQNSGKYFDPSILIAREDNEIAGAAIFSPRTSERHHIIKSRAFHLNEAGGNEYDFIVEHNGILTTNPDECKITEAVLHKIIAENPDADEFVFSGINKKRYDAYIQAGARNNLNPRTIRTSKFSYVNLDVFCNTGTDYLSTLSRNTRSKIRRSLKAYETQYGKIRLDEAEDLDQALQYLEQLKILHQKHWTGKGLEGSFGNPRWEAFIKDIIQKEFNNGGVQLLRIHSGDIDIGYIFNLVNKGYVNMLQSGFEYPDNNKMKPGYVSHYLAIEHNIQKGYKIYDFLAGDSQYKDSLATASDYLYWLTLQHKRPKFMLENLLIKLSRHLRGKPDPLM